MSSNATGGESNPFLKKLSSWRHSENEVTVKAVAAVEPVGDPSIDHAEGVGMIMLAREAGLLVEAFETEIKGAVVGAVKDGEEVDKAAKEAIESVNRVSEQAEVVSQASEATVANVESVASATEELASSETQVTSLVHRAEEYARDAVEKADRASGTVGELAEASNAINGIVVFIEDLARRTNMLALNASIEAQRAGAAGKGFAVVAGEVKDLAKQTATATRDIREKIAGIQKTTAEATDAISVIAKAVSAIQNINGEVAASVTQQAAATNEISRNAQEASSRVSEVTGSITDIAREARNALSLSQDMEKRSAGIAAKLRDMRNRLGVVVKASRQSKRSFERMPVDMPASVIIDGQKIDGLLVEMSVKGACFKSSLPLPTKFSSVTLELPWLGQLGARGEIEASGYLRLKFEGLSEETRSWLVKLVEHFDLFDVEILKIAQNAANQASELFEKAVDRGEISLADLFDEDYQPVAGSNPQQYLTKFTTFTERVLPPIQEPAVASHPRIVAVVAVDRNGYLPINALKYSQPQGPDPVWNAANCRHRRLLNDHVGLSAARNLDRVIFQTYIREVGTNNMLLLKDLGIPMHIKGRHWGAMRCTYKSQE